MQKNGPEPQRDERTDRSRRSPVVDAQPLTSPPAPAGPSEAQTAKASAYEECFGAIVAVWKEEGGKSLDDIALMATINSVLANRFSHYFWTGFYRVCGERLVVGPYIGTVGCLQIEFGKGVCGTAAAERKTLIVPDVDKFPGHIACDAASKSEIVVPVFGPDDELIAVLDVDSNQLGAFDGVDRTGLERIVRLFHAA